MRLHRKGTGPKNKSPYRLHPSPSGRVARVTPQESEWPASRSHESLGRVLQAGASHKDKRREFRLECWKCCIVKLPRNGAVLAHRLTDTFRQMRAEKAAPCVHGLDCFERDLGRAILQDIGFGHRPPVAPTNLINYFHAFLSTTLIEHSCLPGSAN
jgi:hypothetical protein